MPDTPFENVSHGSLSIADVNLDSFPDVFISGYNGSTRIAKLYINDSQGNFSELEGTPFQGVSYSSSAIEDINGDNHPDILITGWNSSTGTATLYGNNQIMSSVKETLPLTNFQFEIISNPIQSESIELKIYSQNSNIINISIFDLNGKLLKEQQIQLIEDEQSYFFDISRLKLNKGTYLLQLQDKESRSSKKIVIH